ncbi:MAG: class I SAM-dependent methyltransferase [Planctomycetota bacterium]|jgi:2-polyprenyl-3-methyl-5-hydroxy-6-metoxy-1,4-benzoquinol methylase
MMKRPSLLSMLPSLEGLSVLDMGCGSGVYAEELLERGASVTAVDSSTEMISIVKTNLGEKLKAYVQDLTKGLPLEKSHTFDLVISPLVIHYIEDLQNLFNEVSRVLKPGG